MVGWGVPTATYVLAARMRLHSSEKGLSSAQALPRSGVPPLSAA